MSNSQIKAWALDRAIETLKISAVATPTAQAIKSLADEYTAYVGVQSEKPAAEPEKGFDDDAAALALTPASEAS